MIADGESGSSIQNGRPHPNGASTSRWRSRGTAAIRAAITWRTTRHRAATGLEHEDSGHLHRRAGDIAHQIRQIVWNLPARRVRRRS
jgi:hypothetical protein